MYLLVAATGLELEPLQAVAPACPAWSTMLSGVGPVEAAWRLAAYLARLSSLPQAVINFGLAGAFPAAGLDLLDLCLAEAEILGDLGIVGRDGVAPLPAAFAPPREFACDPALLARAEAILTAAGLPLRRGRFVTLSGVSGTRARAESLRECCQAVCENMEGAALARVCQEFGVPFLALRCISNLAIDREEQVWLATEAARRCGQTVALLLRGLADDH
ncbi:MAG: futalosine hydrolase [Desulfobulbaceae bacterium]|nr:futalosine hydrolase [Desulfobulbaceae bacterium]